MQGPRCWIAAKNVYPSAEHHETTCQMSPNIHNSEAESTQTEKIFTKPDQPASCNKAHSQSGIHHRILLSGIWRQIFDLHLSFDLQEFVVCIGDHPRVHLL